MPKESKAIDPAISSLSSQDDSNGDRFEEMSQYGYSGTIETPGGSRKKKQRSKKKRVPIIKQNGSGSRQTANTVSSPVLVPTEDTVVIDRILEKNQSLERAQAEEMLRLMKLEDKLTGGKKDMESYKFWNTQPIARFGGSFPRAYCLEEWTNGEGGKDEEGALKPDGPVRDTNPEVVPPHGVELLDGFEWVTMDINDTKHVRSSSGIPECFPDTVPSWMRSMSFSKLIT